MKRLYVILISMLMLISFTNCSTTSASSSIDRDYYQVKSSGELEKSFNVKPGGKLEVNMDTGGSIKVVGWDKDVVDVKVELKGRDKDNVKVSIDESSNGVEVSTEFIEEDWDNDIRCKVVIKVPLKYNVEFETMGGSVTLQNIEGKFEGKTMGGAMKLSNLTGKAEVTTMGGSIDISDSDLDGEANTMGGAVDLDNVTGNISAKTMGGSIRHDVKKRADGSGSKNKVNIETMGGDIDVTEAYYGAKVKTMGGSIKVKSAAKFVDAHTMGGHIKIGEVDGWVKAKTMGGNINCTVVGDNNDKDVTLTSMGGDITLYVPENFSAKIDIEIKYDKRHEDDVEIVSDFDIDTEVTKKKRRTRVLKGTGTAGGGENTIKIRTVGGSVYLKKK